MDNDFKPDIVLATNNNNKIVFEVWQTSPKKAGTFVKTNEYTTPDENYYYGQSLFADFGWLINFF